MSLGPNRQPPGWGDDDLSQFIDMQRNNVYASFANLRSQYQRLVGIDAAFRLIADHLTNPDDWFVPLFLLRAHSTYLGGVHLALAGQVPEAYMLLRGSIENAVYGFYFHHTPDSQERWLRRHDSDHAKKVVKDEFRIAALLVLLKKHDERLGDVAQALYDRAIEFGGHPNARGLLQVLKLSNDEGKRQFNVQYLSGHTPAMEQCLRSAAQVGVLVLRVFQHVLRQRYDLLGLSAQLTALEDGL